MLELSIYVHIPFCESKCSYCNFISDKQNDQTINAYFKCLLKEIKHAAEYYKNYSVKSIYFGGGTPSFVDVNYIKKTLNVIRNLFTINKEVEITIECNPNSLTENKAKLYKEIGINRVSVGLQSANNNLLKMLNRPHTIEDFKNSVKYFQNVGINNISVDILVGIPNQKMKDIKKELKLLTKMGIKHISAYALMLEEGTLLFNQIKNNKLKLPSEDKCLKYYEYIDKYLKKHNIHRYEVSNFAKVGYESKHNYVYWNYGDYLGFGLAAHSKINNKRFSNTEKLNEYLNGKMLQEVHLLTQAEQKEEIIMLSLRTVQGLNITSYNAKFDCDLLTEKKDAIKDLLSFGLIELKFVFINNIEEVFLKATRTGFSVLNSIILSLI